jgi:predicted metallopeptidase
MGLEEEAPLSHPPLVRRWGAAAPLPVRALRVPAPTRHHPLTLGTPPGLPTGPLGQPFDFCGHVARLCADMTQRCAALQHIDAARLLFGVAQARSGRAHGLQARVWPLRCHAGRLHRRWHGTLYQVQRYFVEDREMLYLVTFYLPRFQDQSFDEKFITLFHELYHISPAFDGDLRRHDGRYAIHSHGKRGYDRHMADLARAYLAGGSDPALYAFLRLNFAQLQHRHGAVLGVMVPRPKLIPIAEKGGKWASPVYAPQDGSTGRD